MRMHNENTELASVSLGAWERLGPTVRDGDRVL